MSETISVHNMFSPDLSLEFSCTELVIQMNNLSSYCGLVDAKNKRASDKDLPVQISTWTEKIGLLIVEVAFQPLFLSFRSYSLSAHSHFPSVSASKWFRNMNEPLSSDLVESKKVDLLDPDFSSLFHAWMRSG